jgi:hypothetical protein
MHDRDDSSEAAPHPPFGHLLPACGEKDIDYSISLAPRSGERVALSAAKGRVRVVVAAFMVAFVLACNKPLPTLRQQPGPQIHATVVTIVTTIQPANKTFTHTLIIANGRARSGDEVDHWRLFDFAQKRVTFVDDLTRTYRNATFDDLIAARRTGIARPVPEGLPRAQFAVTSASRSLQGVMAKQSVIRLGAYQRELWIGSHPLIPKGLFAMLQASEPVSSPLAGVTRSVDEAVLEIEGFPLADHSELPYENKKLIVDHNVVKIEQRDVPASWLNLPRSYTTTPKRPAANSPTPPK